MAKRLICTLWAVASVAASGNVLGAPEPGTISVSSLAVSGCTFTINVTWSGFTGARDTLEASLLKVFLPTGDGIVVESVTVRPIKGKGGSVSLTPPALAESATPNYFRAEARLFDQKDVTIGGSPFSDIIFAYCDGP